MTTAKIQAARWLGRIRRTGIVVGLIASPVVSWLTGEGVVTVLSISPEPTTPLGDIVAATITGALSLALVAMIGLVLFMLGAALWYNACQPLGKWLWGVN